MKQKESLGACSYHAGAGTSSTGPFLRLFVAIHAAAHPAEAVCLGGVWSILSCPLTEGVQFRHRSFAPLLPSFGRRFGVGGSMDGMCCHSRSRRRIHAVREWVPMCPCLLGSGISLRDAAPTFWSQQLSKLETFLPP
jgi:hypothetical protein